MPYPGYSPTDPPHTTDPTQLANWAYDQFNQISGLLQALQFGREKMQHTAPKQVYDGLLVLADGSDWNPGSGRGFYGYHTGAWHFLG
jgi:hypothetical protein